MFNYYLQATETEVSVQKLKRVIDLLAPYQTKLILYTYDSMTFDVPMTEAREVLPLVQNILEMGNFPVKVSVGNIYSQMNGIIL